MISPRMDWDMKYELRENARVMRKATYVTASKEFADVGDRASTDIECLRASSKANLDLAAKVFKSKPSTAMARSGSSPFKPGGDLHDFRKMQDKDKIVAKKSFFLNPHRNDPKIIKTKNRLYVI